jgi:hypothetical protein
MGREGDGDEVGQGLREDQYVVKFLTLSLHVAFLSPADHGIVSRVPEAQPKAGCDLYEF